MNLSDIITKCYILALIIRDDGERLLLGDGIYEFKSSLQHFAPNIYQNDVVELQGTDGQLLAGQVRRSATQAFDGYIADGTIGKTDTEQSRRRFLGFFRKKHHYKVVYIMPDGTAVQRDRGYIVDAPAVQELYQRFPEYHIGLNFEDPNYYEYSENDEGEEIYTHIQAIALFRELEAGLVWDAFGAVSDDIAWTEYMTKNSTDGYILIGNGLPVEAPLSLTHLTGNAEQKTLSGKNLLGLTNGTYSNNGITATVADGVITLTGTATSTSFINIPLLSNIDLQSTWSISLNNTAYGDSATSTRLYRTDGTTYIQTATNTANAKNENRSDTGIFHILQIRTSSGVVAGGATIKPQVELGSTATAYEPYVGGIPSPNPDFPQAIKTVSGAQTVKITGKNWWGGLPTTYSTTSSSVDFTTYPDGSVSARGTSTATAGSCNLTDARRYGLIIEIPAGTYTISGSNANLPLQLFRGDGTILASSGTPTFTVAKTTEIFIRVRLASGTTVDGTTYIQLERNNQATDYEPHQSQSQEINLGSLELAKIDTYQDYIWNDGGTWKIHQAVRHQTLAIADMSNGENWPGWQNAPHVRDDFGANQNTQLSLLTTWASNIALAAKYLGINTTSGQSTLFTWNNAAGIFGAMTQSDVKTAYPGLTMELYYGIPQANQTDTEITDSELIAQLNHIYSLYQGTNNLWLIPSAGAQGEMTVRFGVAYDDDGSGYHWSEELGSPDNIISNDGIDSVRPIWAINGPATDPTLTNITTAQTITWNGTVPADSTLIIDMERQTATLNGANVYAQIEGDWLELAVGPNKLQYVASGGATADSTLEWNGVAG